MKFAIIIPTYNAGQFLSNSICTLTKQTIFPSCSQVYIIDSSSRDNTIDIAKEAGLDISIIPSRDFNHGGTRNIAVDLVGEVDVIVFLTQDAFLSNTSSLYSMIKKFDDQDIGAVCGRQIPHDNANPIAAHARFFNYPDQSRVMGKNDIAVYGIKAAFVSNSFTAYRSSVFKFLGGFPEDVILSEDMYLAAHMILSGYKIAYEADACVKHSHNYTPWQEFKRYFDIGVFHSTESWIQEKFGGAGGEGKRFLISEFKYLLKHAPMWIPRACITNFCKILGYKLGKNYKRLPKSLRPKLSMHKAYWSQKER
ncbi:glycosyltransferase family 2 protein [Celerinatantimonas diazotrophica]|uniref:Rhamnosyltransferase n=1 Tax=Celerinatantimonas diazotrophica TaxID=412034 RepID=A0A4R1K4K9_9GAMM|nr:glycosyltransferase [Celerinatantimonas diazotrophica]TCK59075.1 rhamnosyltransferase [Celerinatantimonas diazotrophica]CAG9297712.1 hypothetical protein CEDIAZO_02901 [Celerinatantimonas diazotrophica]